MSTSATHSPQSITYLLINNKFLTTLCKQWPRGAMATCLINLLGLHGLQVRSAGKTLAMPDILCSTATAVFIWKVSVLIQSGHGIDAKILLSIIIVMGIAVQQTYNLLLGVHRTYSWRYIQPTPGGTALDTLTVTENNTRW